MYLIAYLIGIFLCFIGLLSLIIYRRRQGGRDRFSLEEDIGMTIFFSVIWPLVLIILIAIEIFVKFVSTIRWISKRKIWELK